MSADNWATCPRCEKKRMDELAEREAAVFDSYGTVSIEDFDAARAALSADKAAAPTFTFREDYEIYGAEDGQVEVVYSGHCQQCDLSLKFSHSHPLDINGGAS